VSTPFVAVANTNTCEGCSTCVERCQMEALHLEEDCVVLDSDRCIGCGLCVSTCPTGSLTLARKPQPEQAIVPKDMRKTYIRLGRERGKLGLLTLVQMQIQSKVARLLATK
jgi:ferredoxin